MNPPTAPTTRREAFTTAGLALLAASVAFSAQAAEAEAIGPDHLNVRSFGAKGDGTSDDTAAFQKALDAAHAAGGGRVWVPAGSYLLGGSLLVPHGVCLQGTWTAPISQPWKGPPGAAGSAAGSNLLTTHGHGDATAPAFIRLSGNSAVRGLAIHHPRQTPTDPPIAYPWTIASAAAGADNCAVENVFLANSYQGIDFGHRVTGRHFIRNVYGDVLHRGIFVSQNLDVGRIENVHFWPFWNPDANSPIRQYVQREAVAFEFGRSDWQMCTNTFCWGYGTGYHFITHGEGPTRGPSHGNFLGIAADACGIAVKIEETAPFGLLITNGQFVAFPGEAVMIDVAESHTGSVRFNNCGFWGPCNQIARIKGTGTLGFSDCTFVHWSRHNDRAAIHSHSGKLLVRGCEFKEDKPQITLGEAVRSAIITENLITGKLRVEHAEKANVVVANNLSAG